MSESSRPHEAMLADTSGPLKAGSFRELMSVAVPLVLSSGSLSLMIAIDRLFLTWFSEDCAGGQHAGRRSTLDRDERVHRDHQLCECLRRPV